MSADQTRAVADTVRHAVLLKQKADRLIEQARQAMDVANGLMGSNGQQVEPVILVELAALARSAEVPNRLVLSRAGKRAEMALDRLSGLKVRGDGTWWPARGTHIVYVMEDEGGAVIYIGKTVHASARMSQHDKPWAKVHWYVCRDRAHASELEADLIYQYQPPLNIEGRNKRLRRTA
jgi:hypothetical protein